MFINKCDVAEQDDLELVEMEIREMLSDYGFDGDNCPVIKGSALVALEARLSSFHLFITFTVITVTES